MNLEEEIYKRMSASFEEKLKTLPTPPPGYYYCPSDNFNIRREGEEYIIDCEIELKPIVEE